jgi:hypothetical protein
VNPDAARAAGEAVLDRLRAEAAAYGVDLAGLSWASASFDRQRDPATGEDALLARWQCDGRALRITLRPDGGVYGECDLLLDHPTRPGYWLDTLAIWGMPPALRCEPTLIAKPV